LIKVPHGQKIGVSESALNGIDNVNGEPTMLQTTRLCVSLICACAALPIVSLADTGAPDARALLGAQTDNSNWILPARTYAGNRFTTLTQINKTNVGELSQTWRTDVADDGEQEAAPIVWNGRMYVSTPHGGVLALDATTGKLLWQAP
jgi:alcohol dehydrogenase (cytochrome c)